MTKQIKFVLAFLVLAVIMAGCGNQPQEVSYSSGSDSLTKGEWIGMLGDKFGYNESFSDLPIYSDVGFDYEFYQQIQACFEWEVITEQGNFEPEASAFWEYAIQTSVRAVGMDRIADAGLSVNEDTLVEFFRNNIADTGDIDLSTEIAAKDAEELLDYAINYMYGLTSQERFEYVYQDDVYEISSDAITFRGDGKTVTINDGAFYKAGDIIYIAPSATGTASAIRVTGAENGELFYDTASVDDIYSELRISGSYDTVIVSVEGADADITEVSFRNTTHNILPCWSTKQKHAVSSLPHTEKNNQLIQTGASYNGNTAHFDVSLGGEGEFSIDISNISVTTDIDYSLFGGLKQANAVVSFDDKIMASYTADHYAKAIPLGSIKVQLGMTPCNVELGLVLNIGFDGEATLTYTSNVVGSIGYRQNCGLSKSLDNRNPVFDFHAEATVTTEPTAKVDLRLLDRSIANLKVTTGLVAVAKVDIDILGDQPACTDIYLYVPLRWGVNQDGCIMTNISDKLKYSQTIWDSENSRVNKRFHWEDGVEIPDAKCTRGQKERVETAVVDEDGAPYDEFKLFEFEELDFGIIRTASIQIILEEGEFIDIGIMSIPDGYQISQLVYEAADISVCSVSGGTVKANGNGSTTIKISTIDGKYSTYILVTVNGGYNDTSGFQSL